MCFFTKRERYFYEEFSVLVVLLGEKPHRCPKGSGVSPVAFSARRGPLSPSAAWVGSAGMTEDRSTGTESNRHTQMFPLPAPAPRAHSLQRQAVTPQGCPLQVEGCDSDKLLRISDMGT